jgi:hypothetical protein
VAHTARNPVLVRASVLAVLLAAACARQPQRKSVAADASAPKTVAVRVPGALTIARALDSLSVSIDPASLTQTDVAADPGMVLGVETDVLVFPRGQRRSGLGRHGLGSGADFDAGTDTWNTTQDGIPVPGTTYVVEMQLVLFETDVPAGHLWDPHAGKYVVLWTRTLTQAEE